MSRSRTSTRILVALTVSLLLQACADRPETTRAPSAVLLIVVDTLRADHLGAYGYQRPTSERIDRYAEQGMVFDRVWASSSWTLPTFASLLSGRLPTSHAAGARLGKNPARSAGLGQRTAMAATVPTIAEILRREGFATGAVASNPFLGEPFGLARGFDTYDNEDGRRASAVVDRALDWLRTRGEGPLFLTVHLMDPHLPYSPPPSTRGRFADVVEDELATRHVKVIRRRADKLDEEQRERLVARYDEEVVFVDRQIGRLFDELEAMGRWQDSLVVLTADHGEEFFEHGDFEHGHSLYEELLRVPLMVWGPGIEPGRDSSPVSLVDVAPTILEAVGVAIPDRVDGRSLWPRLTTGEPLPSRPLLAEQTLYGRERKAIIDWPHKLVLGEATGARQLFDLEADPGEQDDLAGERPLLADRLEASLRELLGGLERGAEATTLEIDEELLEELKALGYVD